MKTIKDLKQMISEPASKAWFAKHGSPKAKALHKSASSSREQEIKAMNEKSRIRNMTPIWKDRHQRRHGGKSMFDHSKANRLKAVSEFSKSS